jgi:ferric-dicitrate binding protein FerR (iron transport regulator)
LDQQKIQYALYIGELLHKEADKQPLTEKERADLEDWRRSSPRRMDISSSTKDQRSLVRELNQLNSQYDSDSAFQNILQSTSPQTKKRKLTWLWPAAAALLLFGFSIWMLGRKPNTPGPDISAGQQRQNPAVKKEIEPASNKAILTLANGKQIPLDSASNGQLAQQNGLKITNANGQLTYQGYQNETALAYNSITTPRGGQYHLVLPDGSKVWLNAASSLKYPVSFITGERRVELTGEAYFEIAPNSTQAFIVATPDMRIAVLGTSFDVMAYADEERHHTTLLSGAVVVNSGTQSKQLSPGEQAVANGGKITTTTADIDKVMAWRSGYFRFSNTDIRTLMREVSRWYDIDVVYQLSDYSGEYGGRISRNLNLSELTRLLEQNGIHHYKVEGRKLLVLP